MRRIVLSHFKAGFKKVDMNHVLRDRARLSLSEAKAVVDQILVGEEVAVEIADEKLDDFIEAACRCGVEARATEQPASDEPRSPARA